MTTNQAPHPFRFGVVIGEAPSWPERARAVEDLGYSTLLVPDTIWTPSPFVALAVAGGATTTLRLGTWVLAAPLRSPEATVREARALQDLTGGRLELGIGAGRPEAEHDATVLGVPWGSPGERVARVEKVLAAARQVGPAPRLVVAGFGDRMLRLAGRYADTVAVPAPPTADLAAVTDAATRARAAAGERGATLEINLQVSGVGDEIPEWTRRAMGVTAQGLRDAGAVTLLSGDNGRDAESLRALRDVAGVSYVTVPDQFADRLAPLVAALSGT